MTTMSVIDIVQETVQYYSEDTSRRSFIVNEKDAVKNTCLYLSPDGRMCAVGRCLLDPASVADYNAESVDSLCDYNDGVLDAMLKPEYRGHSSEFWGDLQALHDQDINWDEKGLTEQGRHFADVIINRWSRPSQIQQS